MPITKNFPPDIFTLVPIGSLSKRHFELHPIWSEYYDFEERDEIVAWGIDPKVLASELDRMNFDDNHCAYPILRPYPLPDRMRIYIRARMTLKCGHSLGGHVMNANAFVIYIYVNDEIFSYSRHESLSDLNDNTRRRMAEALGLFPDKMFPIQYETDFLDSDNKLIAGVFTGDQNAS